MLLLLLPLLLLLRRRAWALVPLSMGEARSIIGISIREDGATCLWTRTEHSDVVDAVAPPSHKCLMTNDPASFLKLNDRNWMRKFAARRIQATWLAKHAPPAPTGDGPTEAELAYEASLAEHQRLIGEQVR